MAVTATWSILDMRREESSGSVNTVYWQCLAVDSESEASAIEQGKLTLSADPSDPDFIPYADLTEATVLGWVYDSLIEGEETAEEAKTRIEEERIAKVNAQISAATSEADGVPW